MRYINAKTEWGIETLDEFASIKEANDALKEYRLAYQGTGISIWVSRRSTREWLEAEQAQPQEAQP